MDSQTGRVSDLEEKVSETKQAATNAEKAIGNKETEWLAAQEEFLSQLKKKDTAISSLEEECKELQGLLHLFVCSSKRSLCLYFIMQNKVLIKCFCFSY